MNSKIDKSKNISAHWTMLIVCNPSKIADTEKTNESPMILYFDSLGSGSLGQKSKKVRDYLTQRYKQETGKEIAFDCKSIPGKSPKLPIQPNGYDCGVYLLHYVEMFINKTDKGEFYERGSFKDWFEYSDIKLKRKKIILLLESLTNLNLSYLLTENKFSNEVEFTEKSTEKVEIIESVPENTPTRRTKKKSALDSSSEEENEIPKEEVKKDEIIVNTFDDDCDDFNVIIDENSNHVDDTSVNVDEKLDTEMDFFSEEQATDEMLDDFFGDVSNQVRVNQSFEK
jgi:hypothetical protein